MKKNQNRLVKKNQLVDIIKTVKLYSRARQCICIFILLVILLFEKTIFDVNFSSRIVAYEFEEIPIYSRGGGLSHDSAYLARFARDICL